MGVDEDPKQGHETTGGFKVNVAVIYSNGSQECERMSTLLRALGGEYHEYILGQHFDEKAFRAEFGPEATYPQVALGSKHIGNMKETLQHMKEQGMFV